MFRVMLYSTKHPLKVLGVVRDLLFALTVLASFLKVLFSSSNS